MYEILLTRIFSVTMLYHFAFVALSLAMFGMTVGALIVYLAPGLFPPERLAHRIAAAAVFFPIAIVLSMLTDLSIPFRVTGSIVLIYAVVFTFAVIAVPFIASGVAICLTLTGFPARVSRLYGADLAGAAAGSVLLIGVIGWSDGPTSVLWVAFLASIGAVAFAAGSGSRSLRVLSMLSLVVMGASAAGHTLLVWRGRPVFRIVYSKGSYEPPPLYETWNSYSRVRVTGDASQKIKPVGWGLSPAVPPAALSQLQLDIDSFAGTVLTKYDGDLAVVQHL